MGYKVLGSKDCRFCKQAINLLAESGESFVYKDVGHPDQIEVVKYLRESGHNTVPQIWLGGMLLGGFTDLERHMNSKYDGGQLELDVTL